MTPKPRPQRRRGHKATPFRPSIDTYQRAAEKRQKKAAEESARQIELDKRPVPHATKYHVRWIEGAWFKETIMFHGHVQQHYEAAMARGAIDYRVQPSRRTLDPSADKEHWYLWKPSSNGSEPH